MRKSQILESVITILESSQVPLTAPEILLQLKEKSFTPNKTTLYRILKKLTREDILTDLIIDPRVTHYELKSKKHHHFKCDSCDTIQCVDDPSLEKHMRSLELELQEKGINIGKCNLSLTGKCIECF